MCWRCFSNFNASDPLAASITEAEGPSRRGFLNQLGGAGLGFTALMAGTAHAQVEVGQASSMRKLIPAETLEASARQQYRQTLGEADSKGALAPDDYPQLKRLRAIAARLIPYTAQWNPDSRKWKWEVNLIGSKQINAWCMPGGKIAFYTGILDQLQLNDDEVAMIMGHEMAHAEKRHSTDAMTREFGANLLLELIFGQNKAQLLQIATGLAQLEFGRDAETEADNCSVDWLYQTAYNPIGAAGFFEKIQKEKNKINIPEFLSTHPDPGHRVENMKKRWSDKGSKQGQTFTDRYKRMLNYLPK
jgi:predicted Zn-dependent protease